MGVRVKKVIATNRIRIQPDGKMIVVGQDGKRYKRFNRYSCPARTEIIERERFQLRVWHAIMFNVAVIILLIWVILSR